MKTNTILFAVAAVLIIALAGIVSTANAGVISDVSITSDGYISTSSTMTNQLYGEMGMITSSTFGNAKANLVGSYTGTTFTKNLISTDGKITTSDTIASMTWTEGNKTCNEFDKCDGTSSSYTKAIAGSIVTIDGSGVASTYGTVTKPLTQYGLSATGTGSVHQYADALSMSGKATTSIKDCGINEYRYTESNRVVGGYNLTTKFTFTS